MQEINRSKQIIYFFLAIFLASSIYLFAIDSRYNNPSYNNNWFALSFTEPKSKNLNFAIENFSSQSNFHWEVIAKNNTILQQGDAEVKAGEKKEINPLETAFDKKIIVRVSDGQNTQEIYKNIKK